MPGFDDERIRIDGQRLDADITGRLTAAKLKHTMEGASSVELSVDDADMRLLRSGVLARPGKPNKRAAGAGLDLAAWDRFGTARLTIDGAFFRLAGVSGHYGSGERSLTVTFEDEIAALMRKRTEAKKSSRGIQTRAEFIHWLARLSRPHLGGRRRLEFGFFSPQAGQRQKIAEPDVDQAKKGIHPDKHLTVAANPVTQEQRRNIEIGLKVADEENAGERAILSLLVAGIGESNFRAVPNAGGSNYWGVWQGAKNVWKLTDTEGMARSFLKGGKGFQAGGAIAYAAANPDASPGTIAYKVEGDRSNFSSDAEAEGFYQRWIDEAKAILDAWGGAAAAQTHEIRERFEFRAGGRKDGKDRNYWDDSGELADRVRWRRFANANILWFVDDEWLFSRRPMYVVAPDAPGLLDISFDADVGMPVAEINLTARAARWTTPPGAVFDLDDFGPLSGRWLCWTSEEDLYTGQVDIVLHRPAPKRKEPAPTTKTVTTDIGDAVPLKNVKVRGRWAGTKSIFDQFVTPFMRDAGLAAGSAKRTPADNAAAGGSNESDHLTTHTRAYAVDYPTDDGIAIAGDLARALGFHGWQANSFQEFPITIDGARFEVQILWGAAIDHDDHIHVGIQRA